MFLFPFFRPFVCLFLFHLCYFFVYRHLLIFNVIVVVVVVVVVFVVVVVVAVLVGHNLDHHNSNNFVHLWHHRHVP